MTVDSAPLKISINIKNFSGVTLKAEGSYNRNYPPDAIWAEPVFVTLAPVVVSPPVIRDSLPQRSPSKTTDRMTVFQSRSSVISIAINGRLLDFGSVRPQKRQGRILVPIQPIVTALDLWITTYPKGVIEVGRTGHLLRLIPGSKIAMINERPVGVGVAPQTLSKTMLVPLGIIAQAFGVKVESR